MQANGLQKQWYRNLHTSGQELVRWTKFGNVFGFVVFIIFHQQMAYKQGITRHFFVVYMELYSLYQTYCNILDKNVDKSKVVNLKFYSKHIKLTCVRHGGWSKNHHDLSMYQNDAIITVDLQLATLFHNNFFQND